MKRLLPLLAFLPLACSAQYAPQAGVQGSDAIPASDARFEEWAGSYVLRKGWRNIAQKDSGIVALGNGSEALGPPDRTLVSLGDSGSITLSFPRFIQDGPGPDFAVFENGFSDPADPERAYLELAFVEVSSDGAHFFRFPSSSLTPDSVQVAGVGQYMSARLIHNLAGKYIGGYGTPFDLAELNGTAGLDLSRISHVRIVDAIGTVGDLASYDQSGRKVNDPYPTPFQTGGFDLDAVGVLHSGAVSVPEVSMLSTAIYPNPASESVTIDLPAPGVLQVRNGTGQVVYEQTEALGKCRLPLHPWPAATYYIDFQEISGKRWKGSFVRAAGRN